MAKILFKVSDDYKECEAINIFDRKWIPGRLESKKKFLELGGNEKDWPGKLFIATVKNARKDELSNLLQTASDKFLEENPPPTEEALRSFPMQKYEKNSRHPLVVEYKEKMKKECAGKGKAYTADLSDFSESIDHFGEITLEKEQFMNLIRG